jgi:hypothetical protein
MPGKVTVDDWSNAYLIKYISGDMGDFVANILDISLIADQPWASIRHNSSYYPWSKKWCYANHAVNYLRDNLCWNTKTPVFSTETLCELLSRNASGSNILIYEHQNVEHTIDLKNINLIRVFFPPEYALLAEVLKIYKHKFDFVNSYLKAKLNKDQFVAQMTSNYNDRNNVDLLCKPIKGYKNLYEFNVIKFLFEGDTQGFDFIDCNNVRVKNMINLAKGDILEICDYYGIDFADIPNFQPHVDWPRFYDLIKEKL